MRSGEEKIARSKSMYKRHLVFHHLIPTVQTILTILFPHHLVVACGVLVSSSMLLTAQVISMTFYNEREKSDKFCSEALVSA